MSEEVQHPHAATRSLAARTVGAQVPHSVVQSLNKCLLRTYSVPGTALDRK